MAKVDKFGWQPGDLVVNPDPEPGERMTGYELFGNMSKAEQDEMFGPEVAQKIRDGKVDLADVPSISKGDSGGPGFLKAFRESDHPRNPGGKPGGGRFRSGDGEPGAPETSVQKQARKRYNQLFEIVRQGLGLPPGTPPPELVFMAFGQGYTVSGADAVGQTIQIYINPAATKQLASKDPKKRAAAEFAIFHEFGRVWGSDAQWTAPDGNTGAGRANAFANRATRRKNGKISKAAFRQWAERYMEKWGQLPSAITLPG